MQPISLEEFSFAELDHYSQSQHVIYPRNLSVKNKKKREDLFFRSVLKKFQSHYELPNLKLTKKIFSYALSTHKIPWKKTDSLSVDSLQKMNIAFGATLHYAGQGVYSSREHLTSQASILNYLLARREDTPTLELFGNAKHFLLEKDRLFFKEFQKEWQQVMDESFEKVEKEEIDSFVMKNFVGNLLCLLPYIHPAIGDSFSIPIFEPNGWKKCLYTIEQKLSLTPKWYSSPLPAYGLVSKEGRPLLIFQGTTFPTGDGFWAAIVSDFCFGLPVGRLPYLLGRKALSKWIEKKEKVSLLGVSLGGAIALNVAMQYKPHVKDVNVYNPPGFYPWNKRTIEGMEVNIFSQWNDLVSNMGLFPEGSKVNIFRLALEKEENFIKAHNRAYSGAKYVTYIKTTSQYENRRPLRMTLSLLHCITPLFFLPIYVLHLLYRLFARLGDLWKFSEFDL